ncbi:RNA polymerase sigma factor (sigma-70 family) [Nakamurella sp. UYEF19]|uniref:RNA polymerase sigma factor n=1 Tax=Nakamurella sp. UYEF19 TaxID=1756392 RepID=UPI00339B4A35
MTGPDPQRRIEDLLRELASPVLAVIARRYRGFDVCEDAVQEALLAAALQWPVDGIPDSPQGWLITAASRRWIETWRSESARRRREDRAAAERIGPDGGAGGANDGSPEADDSLTLFFLCCHPALTPVSQVALTLRAVGGLTTSEIAKALLVPESTVAQRISRAKARIRASGIRFAMPDPDEQPARLAVVLRVLYLVFNEGYTASTGERLHRIELSTEAIRLTRQLRTRLPHEGEVAGLLALMLLTDARRPARTTTAGSLVPLTEQDRTRWDRAALTEGTALLTATLPHSTMGQYQVQAAIAAVHGEATDARSTDWAQILGLYDILVTFVPGPVVALNRIVALAMVFGPGIGLEALQQAESGLGGLERIASVRAHLLDLAGRATEAREQYSLAARSTLNLAERQYLLARIARSADADSPGHRTPDHLL